MKLPSTIIRPVPVIVLDQHARYNAMNKAGTIHTRYERHKGKSLTTGDRIATICYQFVPDGVLYGATMFRKDSDKEHWDKKKSRRLALDRLKRAPIFMSMDIDDQWHVRYKNEFTLFQASFLKKRGFDSLEEYTESVANNAADENALIWLNNMNNITKAWNATVKHSLAMHAIRKTMHSHGCWQKNAHLAAIVPSCHHRAIVLG